jgi:vesicle coat complex subunit
MKIIIAFTIAFALLLACTTTKEDKVIDSIIKDFKSSDENIKLNALFRFQKIDRQLALKNANYLIPLFFDKNENIKIFAISISGEIFLFKPADQSFYSFPLFEPKRLEENNNYKNAANLIMPALIKCLKDKNEITRQYAIKSLGQIGPLAIISLPYLIEMLKDENTNVRYWSIISLGNIGKSAKKSLIYLEQLVNSNDPLIKGATIQAIKRIKE